jgi:hypothetical protein
MEWVHPLKYIVVPDSFCIFVELINASKPLRSGYLK